MIDIDKVGVYGFGSAIRGMRNPKNSWDRSDSHIDYCIPIDEVGAPPYYVGIGSNDLTLMKSLAKGGPVHAKYRRMITVYVDITAPLYWWKEFDTYKVGTVANSCSTMHKLTHKKFEMDDFSHDKLYSCTDAVMEYVINHLNKMRDLYLAEEDPDVQKGYWWQMIQLLPSSYNQKRTVMLNYEVLANIYRWRKNHKLDEWRTFCKWIEDLPYSEIITVEVKNDD